MNTYRKLLPCLLLIFAPLFSQTIEEKLSGSGGHEGEPSGWEMDQFLEEVNETISHLRLDLLEKMQEAEELSRTDASEEEYTTLLSEVQSIREEMVTLQERWRRTAVDEAKQEDEGYALFDQEETTLASLVMEYGAADYLYVVPHEMMNMKVAMHSNIPIPREAWSDALEIILSHNGVGVKQINPYARQLYIYKQAPSAVAAIASSLEEIRHIEDHRRIFFVFAPPVEHGKSAYQFFERFADTKSTYVYNVGGKVALVSTRDEIEKLVKLYNTIWKDPQGKVSRVVPVTKMSVKEMETILKTFFSEALEKPNRPPFGKLDHEGLSIVTPAQGNALVLMGSRDVVDRAEKVVKDTEKQLQDPAEMAIYMYNCKHSDPIDIAKVLDKVYYSLLHAVPDFRENVDVKYQAKGNALAVPPDGYANAPGLTVPPQRFKPEIDTQLLIEENSEHFIPDPKTGNLLMVVRRDVLHRIKDLLRQLDVPKRMVQIEVLLFEKKLNNQANYGLNLLKLGNTNGARYDGPHPPSEKGLDGRVGKGVLYFLFSGDKSKYFPSFDFAYSFLMTQEDIQLNAAPSVITVNQTPATISIMEEISLNNGAAPIDTNKGIAFTDSFTRAQYGINIILTPIIHLADVEDSCGQKKKGFITLQTNLTFDTTKPSENSRPAVDKRHIENEVRVMDGETIILGGLRRKSVRDSTQKVPFLGEIPGLGKLFGSTELSDDNTEMFFFITPKIIDDPKEELFHQLCCELERRPGDLPEFLRRLVEARECERKQIFSSSIRAFFGEKQQYYE